jgi:hypothetical protein
MGGCYSSKAATANVASKTLLAEATSNKDKKPSKALDENVGNVNAVNPADSNNTPSGSGKKHVGESEEAKIEEEPKQDTKDELVALLDLNVKTDLDDTATPDAGQNAQTSVLASESRMKLDGASDIDAAKMEPKQETKGEPEIVYQQAPKEEVQTEDLVTTNRCQLLCSECQILLDTSTAESSWWCCK